jgi:sugar (pentulose or hexulose) kinase
VSARIAATKPLTLTTGDGLATVLPAGVTDGDHVTIRIGAARAVLTVRVKFHAKDLIRGH